jgi:hypothetical protein
LKEKDPVPGDNQQAALLPEDGDAPPSSSLKNPPRTKPKGHPKEKEKRWKPLIELREEANEKRRKQMMDQRNQRSRNKKREARPKKCPYCGEKGHTVQECKYMVAALAREEERARGVDLRL